MANISITAKFVHTAALRRAALVLQAAKLYHKEQSPVIETLSTISDDICHKFTCFVYFASSLTPLQGL